jgi:hypothetical protein
MGKKMKAAFLMQIIGILLFSGCNDFPKEPEEIEGTETVKTVSRYENLDYASLCG